VTQKIAHGKSRIEKKRSVTAWYYRIGNRGGSSSETARRVSGGCGGEAQGGKFWRSGTIAPNGDGLRGASINQNHQSEKSELQKRKRAYLIDSRGTREK